MAAKDSIHRKTIVKNQENGGNVKWMQRDESDDDTVVLLDIRRPMFVCT